MTDIQKKLLSIYSAAAIGITLFDSKGASAGFQIIKKLAEEALETCRQQEARGPLTDQEADLLTAPFLLRVLGSSSVFVEQARQLVRAIEAAHRIRGE